MPFENAHAVMYVGLQWTAAALKLVRVSQRRGSFH